MGLSPVAISLLHETETPITAEGLKDSPCTSCARPESPAPFPRRALARTEVDQHFQFKKLPNCYAVGEMLDWEAPTGGYLLQACFSTAVAAARNCLENLRKA